MAQRQSSGSFGSQGNYNRLLGNFGPAAGATATLEAPKASDPTRPPVSDAAPFTANEVFNKVGILVTLAIVSGVGAAFVHVSTGLVVVSMLAAFGFSLAGMFVPRLARIFAPLFAVTEGIALGWISKLLAGTNGAVVPLAVVGTSVVFVAVLVLYRTGLVTVGPKFVKATIIAGFGLLAMMIMTAFGVHLPYTSQGTTGLIVFGFLYLVVAVMDLFVDFSFVYRAQDAGVSKEGEWFAAMAIMMAVVMVYLALLRIFGSR
ncbi:MAG: Bax inhibitor-1/YccA family protein [Actinomycetes bacterium]